MQKSSKLYALTEKKYATNSQCLSTKQLDNALKKRLGYTKNTCKKHKPRKIAGLAFRYKSKEDQLNDFRLMPLCRLQSRTI